MDIEKWIARKKAEGDQAYVANQAGDVAIVASRGRIEGTAMWRDWCYLVYMGEDCVFASLKFAEAKQKYDQLTAAKEG